jgi:DNA-binding NarL/FixJ family response regulator
MNSPNGMEKTIDRTSPLFAGRARELAELHKILAQAHTESVQTVLLTGESGIGKSRLAEEFASRAVKAGWQVLIGRAQAMGDELAFAPVAAALRMGLQTGLSATDRKQFAISHPYLNALLPELGQPLPKALMSPELERTALFETLRQVTVNLAQRRPLLLYVDDVSEADADTLEWLQYFAVHAPTARILLLATVRTPLSPGARGFRQLQSTLARHTPLTVLGVGPLSLEETKVWAKMWLHGDIQTESIDAIHEYTAGVPLFIMELLRMLLQRDELVVRDGRWTLRGNVLRNVPSTVAMIIGHRMNRLSAPEQTLCRLLAASDGGVPWTILQNTMACHPHELAETIDELLHSGLICESDNHQDIEYRFRHPMIKEAVYAQISATALRRIHQRLAEAWGFDVSRSARHVRLAGAMSDAATAVRTLFESGLRAIASRSYHAAVDDLELAVRMMEERSTAFPQDVRAKTRLALGEAWMYARQSERAAWLFVELFQEPLSTADKIHVKRCLSGIESTRSYGASLRHMEDGLQLWDVRSENEDVLWMLDARVSNYLDQRDLPAAIVALEELIQYSTLFPTIRNRLKADIRAAYVGLLDWNQSLGQAPDAQSLLPRALSFGEIEMIGDAYCLLGYRAVNRGDFSETIRYATEGTEYARRYDMVEAEIFLRLMGVCGLFMAGKWGASMREAGRLTDLADRHGMYTALACVLDFRAMVHMYQDKRAEANVCLEKLEEVRNRLMTRRNADGQKVMSAARTVELLQQNKFDLMEPVSIYWAHTHGMPLVMKWIENVIIIRSARPLDVLPFISQLRSAADGKSTYYTALADFLEGRLAIQQGDLTTAMILLERAIHTFEALHLPLETALSRAEYVTAVSVHSADSVTQARKCRDAFHQLGILEFERWGQRLLDKAQAAVRDGEPPMAWEVLSRREREIADCVARGKSNLQIAEHLGISGRTVTKHLENIYKKLGVNTRILLTQKLLYTPQE